MSLPMSEPRITSATELPLSARNSAAWPAELPPPTTTPGAGKGTRASFDFGRGIVQTVALGILRDDRAAGADIAPRSRQ